MGWPEFCRLGWLVVLSAGIAGSVWAGMTGWASPGLFWDGLGCCGTGWAVVGWPGLLWDDPACCGIVPGCCGMVWADVGWAVLIQSGWDRLGWLLVASAGINGLA